VMEPERVRARAQDLNATNAEFLAAAWASASDGASAPLDLATAGSERKLATGDFASLAETVEHARAAKVSWWAITSLGADDELDLGAATIRVLAREPHG
ncbi:hypothetical protein BZG21_29295, partial [Escherichia coli]|nr:hypothetical protein [Escherichia coli]